MTDVFTILATATGAFFFLAGSVGLLRFPDLFSRLHALTKADNLGLGFVAFGVVVQSSSLTVALKILLIWLMTIFASATISHLIARDAYARRSDSKGASDVDVAG